MTEAEKPRKRIELIDTLRGVAVFLMVFHHFFYDLCWLLGDWTAEVFGSRWVLFSNPVFNFLHYVFAGLFIFLAGLSCRLSRSNLKRGAICFAIAMAMTFVTSLPVIDSPIRFGVLHLLGTCMMIYGLAADKNVPRFLRLGIYLVLFAASFWLVSSVSTEEIAKWLFPLGWTYPGFYSADYFPLFPWLFVFLVGSWAGYYVADKKLPARFYDRKGVPFFSWLGKKALIIYIIHQPILYGLVMLIKLISQNG